MGRVTGLLLLLGALTACGGAADPADSTQNAGAAGVDGAASGAASGTGTGTGTGGGGTGTGTATPVTPVTSSGTTYHVRADGGDASQCTGLADAAYPGQGAAQPCAWSSPMVALPNLGTPRIAGGDTLLIHAGQYMIGIGAPDTSKCSTSWPWDCGMLPVPSGPDAAHPTRILGEGHANGCANPPQLWGTQRVSRVLGLERTRHAQIACLEITDHSPCVLAHGGSKGPLTCQRDTYPHGEWAVQGIYAEDSVDVTLQDLNIHGLAGSGVLAGRLTDWTVLRVRVAANGWAGWDGDIAGDDSTTGTMRFSHFMVEWNGCGETYPGKQPTGCWGQSAGGYGDGVGLGETGGNWVFEDTTFQFNTSDGLDLLYHKRGGQITLNRVLAQGNAGNQIKTAGSTAISNTVVHGNCGFFKGKPFTYDLDHCRALGDTLALAVVQPTDVISVVNTTLVSEGNVAILVSGSAAGVVTLRNNIMVGLPIFHSPDRQSADTYIGEAGPRVDESHAVKQGLRNANCSTPFTVCTEDAGLRQATAEVLNPELASNSVARRSGMPVGELIPATDFNGSSRPTSGPVDRGALQMP